ncbi:MAG: type VI secretion system tip protein VgrG [Methylococcaceae bacterium]|nr:type VI secretion system tip protein VgrG [Methylococcaceae bacterium]
MDLTQSQRNIQISTPLGPDKLLFYRMAGSEQLSALFEYDVELLSPDSDIDPEQLLGQNVTIKLELPQGGWRYFNGHVSRFGHYGTLDFLAIYRALIRPWPWFLTCNADCRIFQNKTIPDIVKEIFRIHGHTEFEEKLSETYKPREYCVQYRETDFNFVSRLLEEEGIGYFFRHTDGKHTLVMTDSVHAYSPFEGYAEVPFIHPGNTERYKQDHIDEWMFAQEVQPGAFAATNYDFTKPRADLKAKSMVQRSHPHSKYELFDYPGPHVETEHGESYTRRRIEEHHARFEQGTGHGNARGLACGYRFKLMGYPRDDRNREYLVTGARFQLYSNAYLSSMAGAPEEYSCQFSAIDAKTVFRPQRVTPKPFVQGPQTAVVTGPAGEEIYTDEHGQVKVKFHWDRYSQKDETSSCWVRVSHPWAGQGWGAISIPRIGQEVIVDFLEGDPDRPIITGRVYNADTRAPFALPGAAVISGIKSDTHKGAGYNEISMDDTAGKEKFLIHSQYDMTTTVRNNDTQHVMVDRTIHVDGKHTETIKKDLRLTVAEGDQVNIVESGHLHIQAAQTITLKVGGSTLQMDKDGNILVNGAYLKLVGSSKIDLNP